MITCIYKSKCDDVMQNMHSQDWMLLRRNAWAVPRALARSSPRLSHVPASMPRVGSGDEIVPPWGSVGPNPWPKATLIDQFAVGGEVEIASVV